MDYRARAAAFGAQADQLAAITFRLANARLGAFLGGLVFIVAALWSQWVGLLVPAAVVWGLFVWLVMRHRAAERERKRFAALARINVESAARADRLWDAIPLRHSVKADADHPYADDLDLFGHASLMHLLDNVVTTHGERMLAEWLSRPGQPAEVAQRHRAAQELAPLLDLRQAVEQSVRGEHGTRVDASGLLGWVGEAPWLRPRGWVVWLARVSPAALWVALVAYWLDLFPYPVWLAPLAVNAALAWYTDSRAVRTIERVSSLARNAEGMAHAFREIEAANLAAPLTASVQRSLRSDGVDAARELDRLGRIARWEQPPSTLVYPGIALATLWNTHVLVALEEWQRRNATRVSAWIEALAQFEAISALAGLAHDNPSWVYPTLDPSLQELTGDGVGHPLLPADTRVGNSVSVGPAGTFLLVTGSNMSGKSTLLRAIGLNTVLAQAGGPACAAGLSLPPVALWTCMRVRDSLERGVSYYMAELQRLKRIVDASAGAPGSAPLLFLLDEILQGTNTAERQIAARQIISWLIRHGAIGAVSTHDLTLAEEGPLRSAARDVHLQETIREGPDGAQMTFDYRLHPGIARSTNALRLLEMVGIPTE
ncbi:MAG: hypothetical protein U0821_23245 [Chloroflexota bacterium]